MWGIPIIYTHLKFQIFVLQRDEANITPFPMLSYTPTDPLAPNVRYTWQTALCTGDGIQWLPYADLIQILVFHSSHQIFNSSAKGLNLISCTVYQLAQAIPVVTV
jgi:hypothetical protein